MAPKNTAAGFETAADLYNKKTKSSPVPEKQIGVDTNNTFFDDLIANSLNSTVDMNSLNSFLSTAKSRDQIYSLLDEMGNDSTISAVLETYAEDSTVPNEDGRIVWVDSDDSDVASYITYLLDSMRVDKNAYVWTYSLCKYGDLYLRLYRKSEYEEDVLEEDIKNRKTLNEEVHLSDPDIDEPQPLKEDINVKAYSKNDHYVHYVEMMPNPAEMFELTKFGKSYAYIEAQVPLSGSAATNANWLQNSNIYRYQFSKNDINVYAATEFAHGCLEDNSSRTPEEVKIFLDDTSIKERTTTKSTTYKVRRGQSLLYNTFQIWRELKLLENSILLNRLTKSSVVRAIGVEVGDMPKEMVGPHLQGIKSLLEQKSAIDTGKSLSEYTNPGPVENNVYIPTREGKGALTIQQIGGEVNVGQLTDLDYFRDKMFANLKVPKQFFGFTSDGAGFDGGKSLSIISSRYAKTVRRIQNTLIQTLTDVINLMLLDRGLTSYVNKFKLHMMPPTTQEEIDRRENEAAKVQLTDSVMQLVNDNINDPVTKLSILKTLLSGYITDPEVINLIQKEIDKLESESAKESSSTSSPQDKETPVSEEPDLIDNGGGIDLDSELNLGGDTGFEESPVSSTEKVSEETILPTPEEMGIDFTDSNAPEFQ